MSMKAGYAVKITWKSADNASVRKGYENFPYAIISLANLMLCAVANPDFRSLLFIQVSQQVGLFQRLTTGSLVSVAGNTDEKFRKALGDYPTNPC